MLYAVCCMLYATQSTYKNGYTHISLILLHSVRSLSQIENGCLVRCANGERSEQVLAQAHGIKLQRNENCDMKFACSVHTVLSPYRTSEVFAPICTTTRRQREKSTTALVNSSTIYANHTVHSVVRPIYQIRSWLFVRAIFENVVEKYTFCFDCLAVLLLRQRFFIE